MTNNNTANVAAGKPRVNGAIFVAPVGSTLPTDASTVLDAAFINLGFISDDGVTLGTSRSVISTHAPRVRRDVVMCLCIGYIIFLLTRLV